MNIVALLAEQGDLVLGHGSDRYNDSLCHIC